MIEKPKYSAYLLFVLTMQWFSSDMGFDVSFDECLTNSLGYLGRHNGQVTTL